MKKLSLNASAFPKGEVLTRAQLKKVLGGDGSGGTDDCKSECNADSDCTGEYKICKSYHCEKGGEYKVCAN